MNTKTASFSFSRILTSLIIKASLLAGTLDILSAFTYYYIKTQMNPLNVLNYVSKVALGEKTFAGSGLQRASGLLVHFAIAMLWTILFFILYRKLRLMRQNKIIPGIVYGLVVWAVMNIVVLPLWNNKAFVFNPQSSSINALILIVAIGLPLSCIAHRHYSKKNQKGNFF